MQEDIVDYGIQHISCRACYDLWPYYSLEAKQVFVMPTVLMSSFSIFGNAERASTSPDSGDTDPATGT